MYMCESEEAKQVDDKNDRGALLLTPNSLRSIWYSLLPLLKDRDIRACKTTWKKVKIQETTS